MSSILLAPGINPSFGDDPAMRIYMFDKNTGEVRQISVTFEFEFEFWEIKKKKKIVSH